MNSSVVTTGTYASPLFVLQRLCSGEGASLLFMVVGTTAAPLVLSAAPSLLLVLLLPLLLPLPLPLPPRVGNGLPA